MPGSFLFPSELVIKWCCFWYVLLWICQRERCLFFLYNFTDTLLCLPKRMSQIDERAVCFSVLAAIFMLCVAFKTSPSVFMALEWMYASGAPHALLWVLGPANSMWLCCESFLVVKRDRFPFFCFVFGLRHKKQLNDALWCSSVSERLSDFGQDLFSVATDGTLFMVMWFWWFLLRMGKGGWVGQKKSVINLVLHLA